MLDGYLGQFTMSGFNASPDTVATAGEYTVIAAVFRDSGSVKLVKNVKKGSGEQIAELKLDAAPIHDGLAIADGRTLVALEDGRLLCLGDRAGRGSTSLRKD